MYVNGGDSFVTLFDCFEVDSLMNSLINRIFHLQKNIDAYDELKMRK